MNREDGIIKIEIDRNIYAGTTEVFMVKHEKGKMFKPVITWEEFEPVYNSNKSVVEPIAILPDDYNRDKLHPTVTSLFTSLAELTKSKMTPHHKMLEGELGATKAHLKDMRTLVFEPGVVVTCDKEEKINVNAINN